jgi:hypothetical protein
MHLTAYSAAEIIGGQRGMRNGRVMMSYDGSGRK